jgi:diguanylate cyclase (GGDEF)-like protein
MVLILSFIVVCFGSLYVSGVPMQSLIPPAVGAGIVLSLVLWLNLRARGQWLKALSHDAKLLAQMAGRRSGMHLRTELYTDELKPLSKLVQAERQKLIILGLTDPLCDVGNRRALEQWLRRLFARPETKAPVSILLIDLDHFKDINDRYGHDIGDQVIKKFAVELKDRVRECDLIARMGGDEFCIVFPQTRLSVAMSLAGRLRTQLPSTMEVTEGVFHALGWTGGLSVTDAFDTNYKQVLKRADRALLNAKHQGRNRTKIYELIATNNDNNIHRSVLH